MLLLFIYFIFFINNVSSTRGQSHLHSPGLTFLVLLNNPCLIRLIWSFTLSLTNLINACTGIHFFHNMIFVFVFPNTKTFRCLIAWWIEMLIFVKTRKVQLIGPRPVSVCETNGGFPTMMYGHNLSNWKHFIWKKMDYSVLIVFSYTLFRIPTSPGV